MQTEASTLCNNLYSISGEALGLRVSSDVRSTAEILAEISDHDEGMSSAEDDSESSSDNQEEDDSSFDSDEESMNSGSSEEMEDMDYPEMMKMSRRDSTAFSTASSSFYSDDDSYDDDSSSLSEFEYADLMASINVTPSPSKSAGERVLLTLPQNWTAKSSAPLPIPMDGSVSTIDTNLDSPMAMLQNLRSELEQVGRMIVAQQDGAKFLERARILASINWLASNVPACVVEHIGKEIRASMERRKAKPRLSLVSTVSTTWSSIHDISEGASYGSNDLFDGIESHSDSSNLGYLDMTQLCSAPKAPETPKPVRPRLYQRTASVGALGEDNHRLPVVSYFRCCVLFIDISGFTKLSTILDPENLSKVINSYFDLIVKLVLEFKGDIQKFAGDALFACWSVSDEMDLSACTEAATACADALVKECADFPVVALGNESSTRGAKAPISTLNIHCGLGVGEMTGIHVGDSTYRREYLHLGDPIKQATAACDEASMGEVFASNQVLNILKDTELLDVTSFTSTEVNLSNAAAVSSRAGTLLNATRLQQLKHGRVRNAKSRGVSELVDGVATERLAEYRRLMSLYVHPVVIANDVAASKDYSFIRTNTISHERHREEAELRSVYTMFINPLVDIDVTGDIAQDEHSIDVLNNIMNVVCREIKQYEGHLRQFIYDDKGLVVIATFGLRGSSFPDLVAQRALPATVVILSALETELGVDCRIGATFGADAYCGAVGGELRHEYSVMGPSVNLAARLMAMPENPAILVDGAVRRLAGRAYAFSALGAVEAKGYSEPVMIFEPLSPLHRKWGNLVPNFVGREKEIDAIARTARDIFSRPSSRSKMILITGSSGMGKSAVLTQALERTRKTFGLRMKEECLVARYLGLSTEVSHSFSAVRRLLLQLLSALSGNFDADHLGDSLDVSVHTANLTLASMSEMSKKSTESRASDESSIMTVSAKECFASAASVANVRGKDLNLVDSFLFGNQELPDNHHGPMFAALTRLLNHVVRQCRLTVLALDDAHYVDRESWGILKHTLDKTSSTLIVATVLHTRDDALSMSGEDWTRLRTSDRFISYDLTPLSEVELKDMALKTLGLMEKDLRSSALGELVVKSGGLPRFAKDAIEGLGEELDLCSSSATSDDKNMSEIVLHRLDKLDMAVRKVLYVGAIVGESFTFEEISHVVRECSDSNDDKIDQQVLGILDRVVEDGILILEEVDNARGAPLTRYRFLRQVRETLLGLMLESRKRELHRRVAVMIEGSLVERDSLSCGLRKVYEHWKASANTSNLARTSLLLGDALVKEGLVGEQIEVYEDALATWGWNSDQSGLDRSNFEQILDVVNDSELHGILVLIIARAKALWISERVRESITACEVILHAVELTRGSHKLEDRSVTFPAFVLLAKALEEGHIQQDVYCHFEQEKLASFLAETRSHGRIIDHIHALNLQMKLYARRGHLDKALAVYSMMKNLYKPEKHSMGLRAYYGVDSGVTSAAAAALYQQAEGKTKDALRTCRYVLKVALPTVTETDFYQSFCVVYPLFFVLKDNGYADQAWTFFEKLVIEPFSDHPEPLLSISTSLEALSQLSMDEKISAGELQNLTVWILSDEARQFNAIMDGKLASLGRCGLSILAECGVLIAERLPVVSIRRQNVIVKALGWLRSAEVHIRRKRMKVALKPLARLKARLHTLQNE